MTNTPSGSKRTWDESHNVDNQRRKRARDKDDPRDWRDVHLNEDRRKPSSARKDRDGRSRHERDYRHERVHRLSHRSDYRSSVPLDYGRDDKETRSARSPRRDRNTRQSLKPSDPDSEKEEGE